MTAQKQPAGDNGRASAAMADRASATGAPQTKPDHSRLMTSFLPRLASQILIPVTETTLSASPKIA